MKVMMIYVFYFFNNAVFWWAFSRCEILYCLLNQPMCVWESFLRWRHMYYIGITMSHIYDYFLPGGERVMCFYRLVVAHWFNHEPNLKFDTSIEIVDPIKIVNQIQNWTPQLNKTMNQIQNNLNQNRWPSQNHKSNSKLTESSKIRDCDLFVRRVGYALLLVGNVTTHLCISASSFLFSFCKGAVHQFAFTTQPAVHQLCCWNVLQTLQW